MIYLTVELWVKQVGRMKRHLITELTRRYRKRFKVISERVYFGTWRCNLCIAKIKLL
jgi:hypothetical protein